ncbi:MAG TPA: metal ABC transporter permease [Anaeromyxobacteraceae bacterium]|nr:metal ABC transporter permease [Anaeromyxobacteraceae bacterium]
MFSGFMTNTWIAASIVAVVAGVVGFFVVLRGSAFVAHAVPHGAFGGAAGAALLGLNAIVGLGVFAVCGAFGIGWLSRRGRRDVATALTLALMLGLGALFVGLNVEYASEAYTLLFGEVIGVPSNELLPIAALGVACITAVVILFRPLMLTSTLPEVGEARGVRATRIETGFLLIVALATTMTVPVVGAFLMFSLMIAPAGTARSLTDNPLTALWLSVAIALGIVWAAIAMSYASNWPIGFFVGVIGVCCYGVGRAWAGWRRVRQAPDESQVAIREHALLG